MKLEDILRDAYEYTTKLFKDLGRLAILIVLNIIPIVNFIVVGYFARVIRESPRSDSPPPLEKYGELWVDGAKIFLVSLVYMIVPIILISVGMASTMIAGLFFPFAGLGVIGVVLLALGIILAIPILIVAIMGIVHMVKTGRMGEAFNFGAIFSKIRTIGWGNYILWIIVIFALGLLLSGLSAIPFIGWLIALMVSPVIGVFTGRSAANIYEQPPATVKAPPTATRAGLFCGYCGNSLQPEDKFCGRCGRPVK